MKGKLLRILIVHEKCLHVNVHSRYQINEDIRINESEFLSRRTVLELQNINDKGTRAIRDKRHYLQRRTIRQTVDFLSK